jgi:hypothetical protein
MCRRSLPGVEGASCWRGGPCIYVGISGLEDVMVQYLSPSQLNQDRLHCVVPGPVGQAGKFGGVDLILCQLFSSNSRHGQYKAACSAWNVYGVADGSVPWIDTWQVDFGYELDERWLVRILITAVHLEAVDSVFMDTLEKTGISFWAFAK